MELGVDLTHHRQSTSTCPLDNTLWGSAIATDRDLQGSKNGRDA